MEAPGAAPAFLACPLGGGANPGDPCVPEFISLQDFDLSGFQFPPVELELPGVDGSDGTDGATGPDTTDAVDPTPSTPAPVDPTPPVDPPAPVDPTPVDTGSVDTTSLDSGDSSGGGAAPFDGETDGGDFVLH